MEMFYGVMLPIIKYKIVNLMIFSIGINQMMLFKIYLLKNLLSANMIMASLFSGEPGPAEGLRSYAGFQGLHPV